MAAHNNQLSQAATSNRQRPLSAYQKTGQHAHAYTTKSKNWQQCRVCGAWRPTKAGVVALEQRRRVKTYGAEQAARMSPDVTVSLQSGHTERYKRSHGIVS